MKEFATLLVGSAMLAGSCFLSWLVGAVMGWLAGRATAGAGGKHQDVEQLLATQRAAARTGRAAAAAPAPGAPAAS